MGLQKRAFFTFKTWIFLALIHTASATPLSAPLLTPSEASLQGDWLQICGSRFQRMETISGNQVQLSEISFLDDLCLQERLSLISSGQITLGGAASTPVGAEKIDFTFEKVEISLKTPEITTYFNQNSICGFSNWEFGQIKAITGLRCDLFGSGHAVTIPTAGEKRFGIYQIQRSTENGDPVLFFGKLTPQENAKSEAGRPTRLDPQSYRKTRSIAP